MSSEPTKEAIGISMRGFNHSSPTAARHAVALAIDAHTAALRAENAHLKSVNEKGLAELARLREQVRLAVEALNLARGYVYQATKESFQADANLAIIDAALRAAGVEI